LSFNSKELVLFESNRDNNNRIIDLSEYPNITTPDSGIQAYHKGRGHSSMGERSLAKIVKSALSWKAHVDDAQFVLL
jgi:hypothetical protein